MAKAGTVEIDFSAETAKFSAALKQVRADMRAVKADTASMANAFRVAGTAVTGFFSVSLLKAGLSAIVAATKESEEAIGSLNNALKNSGRNVPSATKDFQAFASQMQAVTVFSDEAVLGVESMLLRFRGLSDGTIKRATKDILDLSSAMHIDLEAASKSVGLALEDPVKGLSKLAKAGIAFSEPQQQVVKSLVRIGDIAGAQNIILTELERKFKDAAEAARNTFAGALEGLKNSFGDLLEAHNGMPAATKAINELSKSLSSEETKRGFEALTSGLAKAVELTTRGAAGLANFGGSVGRFIASVQLGPDFDKPLTDVFAKDLAKVQAQLAVSQQSLANAEARGLTHTIELARERIKQEEQEIDLLRQKIELAGAKELQLFTPKAAGPKDTTPLDFVNATHIDRLLPAVQKQALDDLNKLIADANKDLMDGLEIMRSQVAEESDAFVQADRDFFLAEADAQIALQQRVSDERLRIEQEELLKRNQLYNDFSELRANINRVFGLQEIQFEKIKNQSIVSIASSAFQLLAAEHSKLFKVQKAFATASVIIDTAQAIVKAMASLPFPADLVAAAKVAAVGAIQLAKIQSVNFSGGGGGGNSISTGGDLGGVNTPNNAVFDQSANEKTFGASHQNVTQITFEGVVTEGAARQVAEILGDIINNNGIIFIDKNSEQGRHLAAGG